MAFNPLTKFWQWICYPSQPAFLPLYAGQDTGGGWQPDPELVEELTSRHTGINYMEEKVPDHTLPDPLVNTDGTRVEDAAAWPARRREILELFREQVYGFSPGKPEGLEFSTIAEDPNAMDGKATMKRIHVICRHAGRDHAFELILFLPNGATTRVPVFMFLNIRGPEHTDPTRGIKSDFWPAESAIERGYGIAALQVGELAPDNAESFREGIIGLFEGSSNERSPAAWGALAAWAWGAHRAMDYFETDGKIDPKRVAVIGHSRGGKAALWAAAEDERFHLAISNNSGCGGAALSRRRFGETISRINETFPYWFCGNFKRYNDREEDLPVDQHMLLSLIAPRPLYVASADRDLWADPRGEFLSLCHASHVYSLFGGRQIAQTAMPALHAPLLSGSLGYHIRAGEHGLTEYDWQRYMDFMDHLAGR